MKLVSFSIIRDDGYAASVGFQQHDLIYRLNGEPIDSPQSVSDLIARGPTKFTIIRGHRIVEINVDSPTLGAVLGETEFDMEAWRRAIAIAALGLTTAQTFADKRIVKTVDIVGAQCIYGVNALADLAAGIREFVGGRSQGLQKRIAEARQEVCRELREEAYKLGANGVIAVTFEHTEIGDKGGFMLMVTGTGTAVIVE